LRLFIVLISSSGHDGNYNPQVRVSAGDAVVETGNKQHQASRPGAVYTSDFA
jgi:hypothetical protein